jgi:hypothetical protein
MEEKQIKPVIHELAKTADSILDAVTDTLDSCGVLKDVSNVLKKIDEVVEQIEEETK